LEPKRNEKKAISWLAAAGFMTGVSCGLTDQTGSSCGHENRCLALSVHITITAGVTLISDTRLQPTIVSCVARVTDDKSSFSLHAGAALFAQ